MDEKTLRNDNSQKRSRRMLDVLNRHRLKFAFLIAGLALLILLADAVLKGSAY